MLGAWHRDVFILGHPGDCPPSGDLYYDVLTPLARRPGYEPSIASLGDRRHPGCEGAPLLR